MHLEVYKLVEHLNKTENTVPIRLPAILSYNEHDKVLTLQKIQGDNISNIYGEEYSDVPSVLTDMIREYIKTL
tara:strand:+ start:1094 stop:1312 length:219 start_codon:yes stop_codon:yes gene_type:complete